MIHRPTLARPIPPDSNPTGRGHLVRFVLVNMLIGAALGAGLAAILVVLNVGRLQDLLMSTADPWPAVALLIAGFTGLLGSLYAGSAIMLHRHPE